ncbi:MAG: tyrosine--tRNA ligase [Solirubrobacterales bacterium]
MDSGRDLTANTVDVLPAGQLADQLAEGRPLRVKLGIDPTAPDIHLGHTVGLSKLRQFQDAGHTVVLIIGDYTARVGDPSGRSDQRPMLSPEQIDANAKTFQEQAFLVLDRDQTEVRFNSEWLDMPIDKLFGLLSRFTVAQLLEREDFARRMAAEQPVSLLELLYPVMQGYDSVAVEADVELGGTDQTFNLLFGREVQQAFGHRPQSIMTLPILSGIHGPARMSKSAGNYIGVTDAPQEMFGKVMRISDEQMGEYYRLLLGSEPLEGAAVQAKRALGRRLVERFHGDGPGRAAEEHFDKLHVRREMPEEIEEAGFDASEDPVALPALIAEHFDTSRSEARRLIAGSGVRLDGEPVTELELAVGELDGHVLQVGKRRFRRLRAR